MPSSLQNISAFDFDGTLTTRDTLLLFIRHARGWWALFGGLLLFSPLLVLMKLHLADNGRTKERLFRHYFRGMLERDFDALCQSFARSHTHVLRTAGLRTVQQALDRGDRVVILSASIDRWVEACLRQFLVSSSQFQVLGTEIEVADGRLTGRFATPNCYGPEKVRRLKEFLKEVSPRGDVEGATKVSPRGDVEGALEGTPFIIAYGDSRGDKELLDYADESHYKPFR